ncbi:MAG: site-specific DNA-methyltransferase, partial [Ralstonia sp.]|nr:site-specific DNA-methyltransferase [Ralstonia sp.]
TYHRMTCAIEDAGFEIREMGPWHYGSGFPKSRNLDGQWEGWGTALKPATEPICMARKPLIGTVAENVEAYGAGAINIDGCRVHADDAIGGEYTVKRFAPGASVVRDGNWKQDVEFRGQMKAGRWPANVIHDGSPEVLEAFPDAPGQMADVSYQDGARKTQNVYGAMNRGHEPSRDRTYADNGGTNFAMKPGARRQDTGSAARFFYCAKASRADRNEGIGGSDTPAVETEATMRDRETADWKERNGNFHPTVKPTDLMAYLCRLVTPPDGTVLDPFMGSGSTGKACMREDFRFIGIDMTPEYVEIARARIEYELQRVELLVAEAARQPDLFGDQAA